MATAPYPRLLGDVGGTNARFAWQPEAGAPLHAVAGDRCDVAPSLAAAIAHYRADHRLPVPASAAIGIANPVTGDAVRMTHHHGSFSIKELEREFGVQRLAVINDFTALALAGEGGHATLAAGDETEDAVIAWLRDRFGHASAERALSGPGLVNLHRAAAERAGREAPACCPARSSRVRAAAPATTVAAPSTSSSASSAAWRAISP